MTLPARSLAACSLAIFLALYVVGAASHTPLRHGVQTLPLLLPIVLGFRQRESAKWAALPCLVFWLLIMSLIWLFLLGWSHVARGHYSPVEIAMTMVIGVACLSGIAVGLRWPAAQRPTAAWGSLLVSLALQLAAFRVSLLPAISHR